MRSPLSLVLFLAIGCSSSAPSTGQVPVDQLPSSLVETAKKKLPGVRIEKAWRTASGNIDMQGKDGRGKIREIHFGPDGALIGVE